MAVQDGGGKDELKTQFITREGTYRLMTLSEYSRPNRVGYTNTQGSAAVRVSFVTLPDPSGNGDRICFNFGRELYVYVYKGVKKVSTSVRKCNLFSEPSHQIVTNNALSYIQLYNSFLYSVFIESDLT